jgi:uncharacterized membrane-anchored protein
VNDRALLARVIRHGALRVPEITFDFWAIEALTTALGRGDVRSRRPRDQSVTAVMLGLCACVVPLLLQLWVRRSAAGAYSLAVVGVGLFGTMAALI